MKVTNNISTEQHQMIIENDVMHEEVSFSLEKEINQSREFNYVCVCYYTSLVCIFVHVLTCSKYYLFFYTYI